MPITEHLDILQVGYYSHLINMPDHRLTKVVFNELWRVYSDGKDSSFKYFETMKRIFDDKGVDYMFNSEQCNVDTFKKLTSDGYCNSFYNEISSLSSLK